MRIVWERSVYVGTAPVFCTLCGQRSYPIRVRNQSLLAIIYDRQDIVRGEACRSCVAAGSDGIKTRLQERIQSLQNQLTELQKLAQETIQTPSLEQEFETHKTESL